MSRVTQEHYRAQNAMYATADFTFESGILTAAQAKSKYDLTVPSNYMVSADGQVWYKLLDNDNSAQLGFTDILYYKQPDGVGWNDDYDIPYDAYDVCQEMRPGDNVNISTYLAELLLNSTTMFMKSPIGNAILDKLLLPDGELIYKADLYDRPIIRLVVNKLYESQSQTTSRIQ